jgi:ABC-2 type transport system permease protein
MNRNLFLMEWRKNRTALMVWCLIIGALIVLPLSFFRTISENQKQFSDIFDILPREALQMKGISSIIDIFSILGFYASSITVATMLLGSIYSIILSSGMLLKEEVNKTAEFLLSKPLSRTEIFLTKYAVVFLDITLLNAVTAFAGWAALEIFKTGPYSLKNFMILTLSIFLLNLVFGFLGLFLSTLVKRPKPIIVPAIGIVLVCYFIANMAKLSEKAALPGYLSPFHYVNTDVVNVAYRLEPVNLGFFLGLSVILSLAAALIYRKKDILV